MKTILENTAKTLSFLHNATRDAGPQFHNNDWLLLAALTPPILAAFAVTEIGAWCIGEIGRQIRIHEKRPASPSLRGTPTPKELEADWAASPRTLAIRLRIGSRLADLDPTLDHTLLRRTLPNGKTVIRARPGGIKGWLADRRVALPYSTAMRYKKLAQRLRLLLALDDRLPLEWVLSGVPDGQPLPGGLAAARDAAHRRLAKLLRDNPTLAALSLTVERKLGIVRLVAVRKAPRRRDGGGNKQRETRGFSVISRGRAVAVSPERAEATKKAIYRVLRAERPSGAALHLQNRLRRWLAGLPPPASGN
jgi:hypothetical protein